MARAVEYCENFTDQKPKAELLYDHGNVRVLRFHVKAGQQIKPHTSASSVALIVLSGEAAFTFGSGEKVLDKGSVIFYEPDELHGFRAIEDSVILAVISPNPSVRRIT